MPRELAEKGAQMNWVTMQLAYIDPGTGSLVLQTLLAAVLSLGIYFRRWVGACFAFLTGRRARKVENRASEREGV